MGFGLLVDRGWLGGDTAQTTRDLGLPVIYTINCS